MISNYKANVRVWYRSTLLEKDLTRILLNIIFNVQSVEEGRPLCNLLANDLTITSI